MKSSISDIGAGIIVLFTFTKIIGENRKGEEEPLRCSRNTTEQVGKKG